MVWDDGFEVERMALVGLAKRASRCADCLDVGDRARRFVGRELRGSWEVGIEEGVGPDILLARVRSVVV